MRNQDSYSGKIPYDSEPIIRQSNYNKKTRGSSSSSSSSGGASKLLTFVVCVLLILNIVLAVAVFSRSNKGSTVVNNNQYSITTESLDTAAVVAKAMPSVVMVNAGLNGIGASNLSESNFGKMSSRGTGVIIEDNKDRGSAYILTCYHVIRPAVNEIYVMLSDSSTPIKATRIYSSATYDLSVISIDSSEEYKRSAAKPCEVVDSEYVTLGEDVVAIGNPQGRGLSVTEGVVSVTSELITVSNSKYEHRVMRISSPINAGNSGGGLFNAEGKLLGIVEAKSEDTSTNSIDCIAYAIPSTLAINLASNIIRNTNPRRAYFGLTLDHDNSVVEYNNIGGKNVALRHVVVSKIEEDSPAASALRVGDRIISFAFEGTVVNVVNKYSVEDYVFAIDANVKVTMVIEREGQTREVSFTIAKTTLLDE